MNHLISVITPVYQCEKYISAAIESVLAQTYPNWELILVDDCTTDCSADLIREYARQDPRIRYCRLETNSGAAAARNRGLAMARGRFIAYLDGDDLWYPQKLERQLAFMLETGTAFTCCGYEKIQADSTPLHKIVYMPHTITYEQLLRNTVIQTVGVMVDLDRVNRKLLEMPDIRRGQDSATWLQLLKNGITFRGQQEVLAAYRRVPNSLSANKLQAMKRTWHLYRKVEGLSAAKSLWCMLGWAWHASLKRIYIGKIFSSVQTNHGEKR